MVAVAAVAATVFLGLMTLKLGRAANAASRAALDIAAAEANARAKASMDERHMLLMWISGEIAITQEHCSEVLREISTPGAKALFLQEPAVRLNIADLVDGISFPITQSRHDRLHVLGHPLAAKLGRAIGLATVMRSQFRKNCVGPHEDSETAWQALELVIPIIRTDLESIGDAVFETTVELGIADPKVVARASGLAGGRAG
ncbi:hypothetical protein C1750_14900 [Stenotrophomonas pavanii]|nr:hypothetical protein C1750_14900 [Stenotrophomonas pavanii]